MRRDIKVDKLLDLQQSIDIMEGQAPLFTITYSNGKKGAVVACRHFMYYVAKGNSFSDFRDKVLSLL